MISDYTLVVGVDAHHLRQLEMTWPTWRKCKPSLLDRPMVIFRDRRQVSADQVRRVVDHPRLTTVPWPIDGAVFHGGDSVDKWSDPQRHMMLAGFVYVPALFVQTPFWLKVDTDTVATGMDDWVDPNWFVGQPAIVASTWTFTKPADQMLRLDRWVEENRGKLPPLLTETEPLRLAPEPGSDRVGHKRIISWCAFFDARWTLEMARLTEIDGERFRLPVPSQDGFLWYCAKRSGRKIVHVSMKSRGWEHWSSRANVERRSREVMERSEEC